MKIALLLVLSVMITGISFSQTEAWKPGQLLIQFQSGTEPINSLRKFEAEHGEHFLSIQELSDIASIYLVTFENADLDLNQAIRFFLFDPAVINVQRNHYVYQRETIPTDTLFGNLWHLKNTGQTGGIADADIDAPEAWDVTTGGTTTHNDTIVACVIEAQGVDYLHDDLIDNHWINYGEIPGDLIDNDNNGYADDYHGWNVQTLDDNVLSGSHGTRVAGMIGGKGNNITGGVGVNWDVKIMVVKGQNANDEASVIAAYNYPLKMRKMYNESQGQEGAFVVVTNASWGINNGDPANSPLWCAMYDTLGNYGILSVGATTNNNSNVDVVGDLPTACTSEFLIGVTMTDDEDQRANSGYGPTHVDLGAPGYAVQLTNNGNSYSTTNGTSFAAPCVSGAIALAYSSPCAEFISFAKYDPAGAALAMRDYILGSVDPVADLNGDVGTNGRLNVNNAIDSIMSNCSTNPCLAPYNILGNNLTDSIIDVSWEGFNTDYILYIQPAGGSMNEISMPSTNNIHIDTLTPCTYYTIYVKADCGTDTSDFSFPLQFRTDGCCENPDLYVVDKTNDSIYVGWDPVLYATSYDLRYRAVGESVWEGILLDTVSPVAIGNLNACMEYEFAIKTTCADSSDTWSSSDTIRTLGCGVCIEAEYCPVIGGNTQAEWIDFVSINTFSTSSGNNNGWLNSDQITTALTPGETYNVSLTPGYAGFNFTERFSLWVDLDHSGTFEASELLINDASSNTTLNTVISIPLTAGIGITKMRIGMDYDNAPVPCPTSPFFGEYEDYCVYIGPQSNIDENQTYFTVYPNPANQVLSIETSEKVNQVTIFSQEGKVVYVSSTLESEIAIDDLASGLYIIQLETESGIYSQKFMKQ